MIRGTESEWCWFSQHHGWVVLDWNDPRNRPGYEASHRFYLICCDDWTEIPIRSVDFCPPAYITSKDLIARLPVHFQMEAAETVRGLQASFNSVMRIPFPRYVPFPERKNLSDLCASIGLDALYHITHLDNLPGILATGLVSHRRATPTRDISNADIQQRRANKQIPGLDGLTLHDCVPLFLAPRPPMLSALALRSVQADIVYLLISSSVLLHPRVVLTDGNARSNVTAFYRHIRGLPGLDWELLRATYWNHGDPERHRENKRRRSAEVLIPDSVAPIYIEGIVVMNPACQLRVIEIVRAAGVRVPVAVRPEMYYPDPSHSVGPQKPESNDAEDEIPF